MRGSLTDALEFLLGHDDASMGALTQRAVARTIWAEARGESLEGQLAVASVIRNRADSPVTWWGVDLLTVCLKPWQFSCFNDYTTADNPSAGVRQFMDGLYSEPQHQHLAAGVVGDWILDTTGLATHYHTLAVSPSWMAELTETCRIGQHVFYR